MLTGAEKPDKGTITLGRHGEAVLRRPEPRPPRRQEDRLGGDLRRPRHHEVRRQEGDARAAPTAAGSTSRAPTSRRRSGCFRAASATACTSPRCSRRAATCCCSTSRPTTSTPRRWARSKRRSRISPAAPWSSRHDRFFLDRLATHILAFEGDSHVEWFEGNFADYEEDKKRRLGDAAVEPHRIKFKRFERA